MGLIRRSFWQLAILCLFAIVLVSSSQRVRGQAATPYADQIEIFRNLTPEQQDAILRQLGGAAGTGATPGTGTSSIDRQGQLDRQRQGLETGLQRPQRGATEGEEAEPLIPVLKGEDWVILEIDFHLPPRSLALSLQALYGGQNVLPPQSLAALQGAVAPGLLGAPAGNPAGGTPQTVPGSASQVQLSDEDKKRLTPLIELIRAKNPYQLSGDGVLSLPGFAGIALMGLTEEQASLRLKAEPAFKDVDIRLTRLPLKKTGAQALKPFGYDLFDRAPSTFAPVTNVPVPSDYVVGAGDQLDVQLYGNQNRSLKLIVDRDGRVNFPELGPISVAGQLFNTVKASIESRVERQLIGVHASVSMGDTRSIRVFVLGEAKRPGSYTISGLGTITSALYAAGGIQRIGSLRRIELKRRGTLVRRLDLYDLLIRGDTTDDTKLLQGDVIFVPPVGATVSVDGQVRRPAIYEIKNEATIADVVRLAGGLTPEADTSNAMLTRIDEGQHRVVMSVDLSLEGGKSQGVRNGDLLRITHLRPTLDSGVVIEGHVYTSGAVAYRQGLRLSSVIRSVDELQPNADIHYLLIRRELPPDRRVAVLSADLAAALQSPGSPADVELMPRDRIIVFDLASGRDRIVRPVLDELRLQGSADQPSEVVHVEGRVKVPGDYPLESGMKVSDLIRAGGGLTDAAYAGEAELTRYKIVNGERRRTELVEIDLGAALRGDPSRNIRLEPFDDLSVKEVPEWEVQEDITLTGELRFPGRYSIRRGETLKSVIARAGGLTEYAFPEGSVFTREELRRREQQQIDMLAERMQRDMALFALRAAVGNQGGAGTALSVGQSLLGQLRAAKAVGRMVIDLPRLLHAPTGSATDVILRGGDALIVPKFQQSVTVIGEVQNSTSHLYRAALSRDDYIALSGGATRNAYQKGIYVVRADGNVVANAGSRWFQHAAVAIKPGDTIVVPLDTERYPALPFWQAVTQILYNVAIAVAAVHSF